MAQAPRGYKEYINQVLAKANLADLLATFTCEPEKPLWHYTTLESFGKIIEYGTIRLGPLDKMNDHQEGRWLFSLLAQRKMAQEGDRFFSNPSRIRNADTFSFSLSAEGDLLSQWRAYSDGGRGVALGFRRSDLARATNASSDWGGVPAHPILVPVKYNEAVQSAVANELFEIASELNTYLDELIASSPTVKIDQPARDEDVARRPFIYPHLRAINHTTQFALQAFHQALRYLEPAFKNPAFSEEQEWRIVNYSPWADSGSTSPVPEFRFRRDDLIPYYQYSVGESLCAVRLGPLCKATEAAVRSFLHKHLSTKRRPPDLYRSKATLVATS